jgi:hypothetical protein
MGGFCVTNPQCRPRRGHIRDNGSGLISADAWSSGEFQNFGLRGNVEYDSAPVAIEGRHDALSDRIGARADRTHRQTAERAVGMRGVHVHAHEHGPGSLIEGKRDPVRGATVSMRSSMGLGWLLSARAIEGVAIPSGPTKLMRGSERICHAAAYAHFFDQTVGAGREMGEAERGADPCLSRSGGHENHG